MNSPKIGAEERAQPGAPELSEMLDFGNRAAKAWMETGARATESAIRIGAELAELGREQWEHGMSAMKSIGETKSASEAYNTQCYLMQACLASALRHGESILALGMRAARPTGNRTDAAA